MYAPRGEQFHRMLLLFGCHSCSDNFALLRVQLSLENEFYPPEAADPEDTNDADDCLEFDCCPACGVPANTQIEAIAADGEEETARVPQPLHRRCRAALDWPLIPITFEEGELIIMPEEEELEEQTAVEQGASLDKQVDSALPESEVELDASETQAFEEIYRENRQERDLAFEQLQRLTRKNPRQVIRYHQNLPPTPLRKMTWGTDHGQLSLAELERQVPPCSSCGGPRQLEAEVLPTLIEELGSSRLSFAMLGLYTCASDCDINGKGEKTSDGTCGKYLREVVVKQAEVIKKD